MSKPLGFPRKFSVPAGLSAMLIGAALLTACGGDNESASATNNSSPNLSPAQQNYENFVLAKNGGLHYLIGTLSISSSSSGALTVTPSSVFYTEDSSLPQSPAAGGPQMLTRVFSTLVPGLGTLTASSQRFLINGIVTLETVPAQAQVSYVGNNVQETVLAADGKTVTRTLLGTDYTAVPLSGTIANSPSELFNGSALGLLTNTLNGKSLYNKSANWQAGAAYLKITRKFVGDTVVADDCVAPKTTGINITPCSTTASTLEGFFPYASATDNKTYSQSDGRIVTLAAVRAWVANVGLGTATPQYRVFYQNNGQIFSAALTRDGATLGLMPPGQTTPQSFYIFLNSAAVQSVSAALTF